MKHLIPLLTLGLVLNASSAWATGYYSCQSEFEVHSPEAGSLKTEYIATRYFNLTSSSNMAFVSQNYGAEYFIVGLQISEFGDINTGPSYRKAELHGGLYRNTAGVEDALNKSTFKQQGLPIYLEDEANRISYDEQSFTAKDSDLPRSFEMMISFKLDPNIIGNRINSKVSCTKVQEGLPPLINNEKDFDRYYNNQKTAKQAVAPAPQTDDLFHLTVREIMKRSKGAFTPRVRLQLRNVNEAIKTAEDAGGFLHFKRTDQVQWVMKYLDRLVPGETVEEKAPVTFHHSKPAIPITPVNQPVSSEDAYRAPKVEAPAETPVETPPAQLEAPPAQPEAPPAEPPPSPSSAPLPSQVEVPSTQPTSLPPGDPDAPPSQEIPRGTVIPAE